jgi:hypothetical protein
MAAHSVRLTGWRVRAGLGWFGGAARPVQPHGGVGFQEGTSLSSDLVSNLDLSQL